MNYIERDGGVYLPFSYKRLVARAPLPRRIYTYIRNVPSGDGSKETLSFNVRVMDEHGVELVQIDEFSEKRINDLTGQVKALLHDSPNGGDARSETAAQRLYRESLQEGITPSEGVDAFARVLAHNPLPQVVVSTKDLHASIVRANVGMPSAVADGAQSRSTAHTTRQPRRLESEYVAPRGEVEHTLSEILGELLGVETVGVHDNFFELGGDSVLSIQVIARAKQSGIQITPQQIFRHQTVAELAAVAVRQGDGSEQLERIDRGGELPLSFAQHRLWFVDQFEERSTIYSISEALRLTGDLNVTVLRDALTEIMRRHEVLRSRFDNDGGSPVLGFRPPAPLFLPVVDLTNVPEAGREAEARRLAQAEAESPFDLTGDPLLRVTLLKLGAREHVGLFTIHHIASDAWSLGVLLKELAVLYDAFSSGRPSPLPELPVQYVDYAAWQRRLMSGPALDAQLGYWKRQLGGRAPVLELPTDRPHASAQGWSGARHRHRLPDELTQRVRALSQREGVTPFMTLLAVFDVLLWRLSGQEDVLVGAAVAGRNRPEADELIGLFINTLVLRTDLSDRPRFGDLLGRVRDVTLGALAHQDVPFDRVVEELRPERVPGRMPFVQVCFGLRQLPGEEVRLPGVEITPEDFGVGDVRYDLTLWIEESEQGLTAIWNYRTALLTRERVEGWSRDYLRLLESALDDPQARVDRLSTETADELRRRQESERDWEQAAADQLLARRRRPANATNL
jgi:aryl carrier-like protein